MTRSLPPAPYDAAVSISRPPAAEPRVEHREREVGPVGVQRGGPETETVQPARRVGRIRHADGGRERHPPPRSASAARRTDGSGRAVRGPILARGPWYPDLPSATSAGDLQEGPCASRTSEPRSSARPGGSWSSSSSRPTPGSPAWPRSARVNKTDSFIAVVEELAGRYVVGADPFDTERLAWAIERLEYGRPSEHGQSALAAFDIASWDLIGQQLGVPVWRLLGGRFRDRVPAYANGWYQADLEPARIAELARASSRAATGR